MRLIDADALGIGRCNPDVFPVVNRGYCAGWNGVIALIEAAPTIEAEPVKRGRWIGIEHDGYADGNPVYDLWECSECGEELGGDDVPDMNPYCRNCGAKMDVTDINVGNKTEVRKE